MRFANRKEISKNEDIVTFVKNNEIPSDYDVYVGFCDSLYAVTEVYSSDIETVISSVETYGGPAKMNVGQFILEMQKSTMTLPVLCEAPKNVDIKLDLQMMYDEEATAVAVDHICKMLVILL